MATHPIPDHIATKSISMPKETYDQIVARMRRLGIKNFSAFMQLLLQQELDRGGNFVIREKHPTSESPYDCPPPPPKNPKK